MSRKNKGKRKTKRQGHFCWACGRYRPNEKFSGRGHARHLCRECAKLGAEELAYRQALRNMERCLDWGGGIRRRRRKAFQQFLEHENPRVRAAAEEIFFTDRAERAYHRALCELDEELLEDSLVLLGEAETEEEP